MLASTLQPTQSVAASTRCDYQSIVEQLEPVWTTANQVKRASSQLEREARREILKLNRNFDRLSHKVRVALK